jgi:hypothetical protein
MEHALLFFPPSLSASFFSSEAGLDDAEVAAAFAT